VDRHDRALHVDQIVLAQIASIPFRQQLCHTTRSINQRLDILAGLHDRPR
jgi:hypothetical protein